VFFLLLFFSFCMFCYLGPGGLGEALDPAGPVQPALEGAARDPRAGHLEDHVRADPPALADQGGVDRHALGGEVLAEHAAGQRQVKLALPAVEVLPGVGVDRHVRTAVVAHVEDPVAGRPRPNPWKETTLTGIDKQPVDGPVLVTPARAKGLGMVGLAGDRVYDVRNHGGPDQAVYAYAREDLDTWEARLSRPLSNGMFGENLTTEGIDVNGALIGERWRVGPDVILEVSCPRIPCGTFQGWLQQAGWIKQFVLAAEPGSYLRVNESGEIL